jgi:hypothetical protein
MPYTLFDRLGCLYDMADDFQRIGLAVEYPRVVLIGERGCGKSCLMRSLTGSDANTRNPIVYLEKPGSVKTCAHLDDSVSGVPIIHVPYELDTVRDMIVHPNTVIVLMIQSRREVPEKLLEMVARLDPECRRTVGVLSWIDLHSPKHCLQALMLNELKLPFKLVGYTSQHVWLEEHAFYSNLPWGFVGVDAVITHIGVLVDRLLCHSMKAVDDNKSKRARCA